MPWKESQRRAIFLDVQRRKGTKAAKRVMHEAGYGGNKKSATTNKPKRKR